MSHTNTNRKLSVTRNQIEGRSVQDVDIDLVYEEGATHLTFGFGTTRDPSGLKSKESLMLKLEAAWSGFLKVLREEGLISDLCSKETTGAPKSIESATAIGAKDTNCYGQSVQYPDIG